MPRFQRQLDAGEEQRASNLELFYDLVFLFAVTQVSLLLLHDLTCCASPSASSAWWCPR